MTLTKELKNIRMNLNGKNIVLSETSYRRRIQQIESRISSTDDLNISRSFQIRLKALKTQVEDYLTLIKDGVSVNKENRRLDFNEILGDRFNTLVREAVLENLKTPKYTITLDLSCDFALAVALTFNEDYQTCKRNLMEVLDTKNLCEIDVAKYFLAHDIPGTDFDMSDLTYKDILGISTKMEDFFTNALIKADENDKDLLEYLGYEVRDMGTDNKNPEFYLCTAISLKLQYGLEYYIFDALRQIQADLNSKGAFVNIASKFIPGFVIYSDKCCSSCIELEQDSNTLPVHLMIEEV